MCVVKFCVYVFGLLLVFAMPNSVLSKGIGKAVANELNGNCLWLHIAYTPTNNISVPNIWLKTNFKMMHCFEDAMTRQVEMGRYEF